ncbi:hypothetical protein BKA65DRAFT_597554 [Rhexocercosporidium sp. MPI-PUGE-AT-0058]|nr:hypothetical protein BKA65DRAFT_597554 [Rhexocercosporidium sp. MPI-PUGE-AT-0058]
MRSRANNTRATYNDSTVVAKPSLLDRLLRLFQFLSSLTSLIVFSIRLRKIINLAGRASRSNGAVEGILAAAVLYTLIAVALKFGIKGTGSNMLRIIFIVVDLLFVCAFITVAGTFILAIVSTLLHAATAAYHVIKDRRGAKTHNSIPAKEVQRDSTAGHANGDGYHGHAQV